MNETFIQSTEQLQMILSIIYFLFHANGPKLEKRNVVDHPQPPASYSLPSISFMFFFGLLF